MAPWIYQVPVFYTNIDCMTAAKHKELELVVKTNDPDLIAITELNSKNSRNTLEDSEIQINGYTIFHNLDDSSRGVCVYVKDL